MYSLILIALLISTKLFALEPIQPHAVIETLNPKHPLFSMIPTHSERPIDCELYVDGFKTSDKNVLETFAVLDRALVWSVDSTLERRTYTNDSSGNMLSELREVRDESVWENSQRYTYSYDSNGKRTLVFREEWIDSDWVNYERKTYTYDNNGRRTSYLHELLEAYPWDASDSQYGYIYNSDGNIIIEQSKYWDDDYSEWVDDSKSNYTYDINGSLTLQLGLSWFESGWVNNDLRIYANDSTGNRISTLLQQWDNSDWVNRFQNIYTHDSNGNITSTVNMDWDDSTWVNDWRVTHSYNDNGYLISSSSEAWDSSYWVNSHREIYGYDVNGNITSLLREDWDGSLWVNEWRDTYTYGNYGNLTSSLFEDWDGTTWVLSDGYLYFLNQAGYSLLFFGSRVDLYYTTITTSLEDQKMMVSHFSMAQNYPNPFNPSTTISYELQEQTLVNLSIYDVRGQEIASLQNGVDSPGRYEVQWNGLDQRGYSVSTGVYFCRLQAGDNSKTIKMLYLK